MTAYIQKNAFNFHEVLFSVAVSENPVAKLNQADSLLRQLKSYWRLAYDLHFMPVKRYEHGSRLLDELGRLLGGWLKAITK